MLEMTRTPSAQSIPQDSFKMSASVEMKRLSEKQKIWQVRHAKKNERRRLHRRGHRKIVRKIVLPIILSFDKNYRQTIKFFDDLRDASERRASLRIDFTTLESIGPAAALVLAAELDSWRLMGRHRIRVLDIDKWSQDIRYILDEMGLFDLIEVINPPSPIDSRRPPIHFIRFKSSNVANGNLAIELRTDLEVVIGSIPGMGSIPGWQHLYGGISEAMTNVRHHAYPPEDQRKFGHGVTRKWWMFGAYDENNRLLTCSFFDRGVGIPATLPRRHARERIRSVLTKLGLPEDDGSLIAAATVMGRTSTEAEHQGRGLTDVMEFVRRSKGGKLRILSRRGQYLYDGEGEGNASLLSSPIGGTLIEWEITLAVNGGRR